MIRFTLTALPCAAALGLTLGFATSTQASLLFEESFTYSAGDLSTESGSVWNDTGTTIESGSLTFGDLTTSGNRVTMSDDSSWIDVDLGASNLEDGDVIWFSVLVNPHNVGTNPDLGFAFGTDKLNDSNGVPMSNSGEGLGFRFKGGLKATTWSGTATSAGSAGATAGEVNLVLGRMTFGATDTIDIWNVTNTDLSFDINTPGSTLTAAFNQAQFDTIAFSDKTANPRDQVDEIRFGTTAADVLPVPEPGSLALLGLGGLLISRRRRG